MQGWYRYLMFHIVAAESAATGALHGTGCEGVARIMGCPEETGLQDSPVI